MGAGAGDPVGRRHTGDGEQESTRTIGYPVILRALLGGGLEAVRERLKLRELHRPDDRKPILIEELIVSLEQAATADLVGQWRMFWGRIAKVKPVDEEGRIWMNTTGGGLPNLLLTPRLISQLDEVPQPTPQGRRSWANLAFITYAPLLATRNEQKRYIRPAEAGQLWIQPLRRGR